jgi:hypothetical protein
MIVGSDEIFLRIDPISIRSIRIRIVTALTITSKTSLKFLKSQRFFKILKKIQKGVRIYPSTVSVPYRTVPYRTVPYRTVPYRTVPYRTVPYRTVPYRTVPYRTVPYRTLPFSARDRFGRPRSVPYFFDRFP